MTGEQSCRSLQVPGLAAAYSGVVATVFSLINRHLARLASERITVIMTCETENNEGALMPSWDHYRLYDSLHGAASVSWPLTYSNSYRTFNSRLANGQRVGFAVQPRLPASSSKSRGPLTR